MNKFLKYFLILLALVLIVVPIVFATLLFKTSQDAFESSQDSKNANRQSNLRDNKVNPEEQPISILFLGIDDNDGRRKKGQDAEHSRSDAMILTTFNQSKHQIRMLSIPRDTISYIPKVGYYDKITHAHAYGGPIAAMDSVEATMNVPVDYYVRVNMKAFVEAVNELGGIYYDVPYDLNEPNTDDTGKIKIKKGYQKLNKILFQKAQEVDSIDKLDNVIQIVGKNAKHNLTNSEIKALAKMYLTNDVEIKTAQLKGKDDMLNGIYYYHPSVESIQKYANLLRNDLELSPINDKNDFLDQRVINRYGSLIPLTPLDSSLLRKEQNDTTDKDKSSNNTDDSNNSNNNNGVNNQQQPTTGQNTNQDQGNIQQTPQASNNQNGVVN